MIKRIVKLTFRPEAVVHFREIFSESKNKIAASDGCLHLELLQQVDAPEVFFTFSFWRDEAALEQYRQSVLFKTTWQKTKVLFAERPQAWSVHVAETVALSVE